MRVVLFGGSGFVGRALVERLARHRCQIVIASRNPGRALHVRTAGTVGQIVPIPCHLGDVESIKAALQGADAVVNCVGMLHESGKMQRFTTIQQEGAAQVAKWARANAAQKLVHISALGADPHSPSIYARTKAEAEKLILQHFPSARIFRPSIIVGPGDNFFNRFARMASQAHCLPLIGGGETRFQPLLVDDLAQCITHYLCAEEPSVSTNTIYQCAGPQVYSFRALMALMCRSIRRNPVRIPIPFWQARLIGAAAQTFLPNPPLTLDQVRLLACDNIERDDIPTWRDLGLVPQAIEPVLERYLDAYRRGGRFA